MASASVGQGEWVSHNAAAASVSAFASAAPPSPQHGLPPPHAPSNRTVESRLPVAGGGGGMSGVGSGASSAGATTPRARPSISRRQSISLSDRPNGMLPLTANASPPDSTAGSTTEAAFTFERTLASELEVGEVFELLLLVQSSARLFGEWSLSELQLLSQLLTVLRFRSGEVVISAGESASFVAILLRGSLAVTLPSGAAVDLEPGGLLGELSCFEGGVRTAEVRAKTDDSAVAILTFAELESLRHVLPELRVKFMLLFAMEGLKKLRRVLDSAPPAAAAAALQTASDLSARDTTSSATSPPSHTRAASLSQASTPQRDRIAARRLLEDIPASPPASQSPTQEREGEAPADELTTTTAAAAPTSASASSSRSPAPSKPATEAKPIPLSDRQPARRTNSRRSTFHSFASGNSNFLSMLKSEAAPAAGSNAGTPATGNRRVEAMLRRRGVTEQSLPSPSFASSESTDSAAQTSSGATAASNNSATAAAKKAAAAAAQHKLQTIQLVMSAQEKQLALKNAQIDALTNDLRAAAESRREAQNALAAARAQVKKLTEERSALQSTVSESQARIELLERVQRALESQFTGDATRRAGVQHDLLAELQASLIAESSRRAEAERELRASRDALTSLASEHAAHKSRAGLEIQTLVHEQAELHSRLASREAELSAHRARANELSMSLEALMHSHRITTQQAEEIGVANSQSHRLFLRTSERLSITARDLASYKKILRRAAVAVFVRDYRRRALARSIVHELSAAHAMALERVVDDAQHTPLQLDVSQVELSSPVAGIAGRVAQLRARATQPSPSLSPSHAASSSSAAASATAGSRSARAHSDTNLEELLGACAELLSKLHPLLVELVRLKAYWQTTSRSFFQRCVELKQQLLDQGQALTKERKAAARARREHDELQRAIDDPNSAIYAQRNADKQQHTHRRAQSVGRRHILAITPAPSSASLAQSRPHSRSLRSFRSADADLTTTVSAGSVHSVIAASGAPLSPQSAVESRSSRLQLRTQHRRGSSFHHAPHSAPRSTVMCSAPASAQQSPRESQAEDEDSSTISAATRLRAHLALAGDIAEGDDSGPGDSVTASVGAVGSSLTQWPVADASAADTLHPPVQPPASPASNAKAENPSSTEDDACNIEQSACGTAASLPEEKEEAHSPIALPQLKTGNGTSADGPASARSSRHSLQSLPSLGVEEPHSARSARDSSHSGLRYLVSTLSSLQRSLQSVEARVLATASGSGEPPPQRTYGTVGFSASPFVASHVVHGVLRSAHSIYSRSSSQRSVAKNAHRSPSKAKPQQQTQTRPQQLDSQQSEDSKLHLLKSPTPPNAPAPPSSRSPRSRTNGGRASLSPPQPARKIGSTQASPILATLPQPSITPPPPFSPLGSQHEAVPLPARIDPLPIAAN